MAPGWGRSSARGSRRSRDRPRWAGGRCSSLGSRRWCQARGEGRGARDPVLLCCCVAWADRLPLPTPHPSPWLTAQGGPGCRGCSTPTAEILVPPNPWAAWCHRCSLWVVGPGAGASGQVASSVSRVQAAAPGSRRPSRVGPRARPPSPGVAQPRAGSWAPSEALERSHVPSPALPHAGTSLPSRSWG